MFFHSASGISGFRSTLRFLGGFALGFGALAQAQTWYWNPSAAFLNGGGDLFRSDNWTSAQDGKGAWPKSSLDDDFTADNLGGKWTFRTTDTDGNTGSGIESLTANADQLTLTGKGADIWLADNQYTGIYRTDLTGDFDVSVELVSQSNSFEWAKAGILVYNDFKNPSAGGCFAVIVTPQNGIKVQYDSSGNVGEFNAPENPGVETPNPGYPVWLRAVKKGGAFTGYYKKALGDAWILLSTVTPQSTADSSQVGLFATSHNLGVSTTAVFDDFQASGTLQSATLDLAFSGTSPTAGENANLSGAFAAHNLDLTGYSGTFSFGSSTLTLSGNAEFSTTANLSAGTGTLAFDGAGDHTLSTKPGAVLPKLSKSGSGTLQVVENPIVAGVLTLSAGTVDLGSRTNVFSGLVASGGGFKAMDSSDTLIFTGDADFSGITEMPAAGTVQIRSTANTSAARTVQFKPATAVFPNLCLWAVPSTFPAGIVVGAGTLSVKGNLILRDEKAGAGMQGFLDFKANHPDVTVDGNLERKENGAAGGAVSQQLRMGDGTWTVKGNVSLSLANGGEADSSKLEMAAASPAVQSLTVDSGSLGNVQHTGTGTLELGSALNALSLAHTAGTLDFRGFDVTVSGDLTIANGTATSLAGLGGCNLRAEGTIDLAGRAENLLNLDPGANWNIYAGVALHADFATIAKSAVTGPVDGIATYRCVDGSGNNRWTFQPDTRPPSIVAQPKDTAVLEGMGAGFSVTAAGEPPLAYAWRKRGDTATLGMASEFTLATAAGADDGALYYCTVTNSYGSAETGDAKLTVHVPAKVAQEPADTTVLAGEPASFSVTASGTPVLGYQWRKAGSAAPLGSGPVLSLAAADPADDGSLYYCIVTNAFGSDTSRQAGLTVHRPAAVSREPVDTAVAAGSGAVFTVGATGSEPIAFAWRKHGDTAIIATGPALDIASAALADSGSAYYCIVSNAYGSDTTREAVMTVVQGALITREPLDISVRAGKGASFSVQAAGAAPLSYAWRRDGDTSILAATPTLTLDSIRPADDGALFTVVVANGFGRDTSRAARLTVTVCDSVFSVSPETLTVDEGQPFTLKGKAACAESFYWSVVSGPAVRLLDPEVEELASLAPRVASDTAIAYRFSAVYGAHTESGEVIVKVREAIPDPIASLPPQGKWTGADPLVIHALAANADELGKSPYSPPLHYRWFLSIEIADTAQGGDSLVLSDPVQEGILEVTLCMDNGDSATCAISSVTVARATSHLGGPGAVGPGPFALMGRTLIWNVSGRMRLWDWQGRLLWEGRGEAGMASQLPDAAARAVLGRRARLEITPR